MLTSDLLTIELRGAVKPGVSLGALAEMPTLLSLEIVRAKALSDQTEDLAASAAGVLKEAAILVDERANGPVAALLGIATGTRRMSPADRRREAADRFPSSFDRFRKRHEKELLQRLAEELVALDSTHQARLAHKLQIPAAVESRLNINWLERHEAYRRIWAPVSALRGDLLILLGYLRENRAAGVELEETNNQSPVPWSDVADRAMNLLWRCAQFTQAVDRFVEQYGGLWLLSDPNQESRAADAIHQLSLNSPCGDADDSWLRLRLAESKNGELDDFINVVYAADTDKELFRVWLDWAKHCKCSLEGKADPKTTCDVHRWLAACDQYITLIDEDWDLVADWYRERREPLPTHGDAAS